MNNKPRFSGFPRTLVAGGAALIVATSALGTGAYRLLKPTAAASGAISTVPMTSMSGNVDASVSNVTADNATSAGSGATQPQNLYEIQQSSSQASFTINEVLRGSPKTVVGATDQVSGQIAFNFSNPSSAQVGTILIDARTLVTDDSSRNRAIANQILSTDQYEYMSFTPTQLSGLPDSVSVGQPFTFQITGDLTIRDRTRTVTFDAKVTPAADGSLAGTASSTIQYADWGTSVPSVPFVASVENQVTLQLTFGATAAA